MATPVVARAAGLGVLIVEAAGNESGIWCVDLSLATCPITTDISAERLAPFIWAGRHGGTASLNPVIGVEALSFGQPGLPRSDRSNVGGDISAPGEEIVSTDADGTYTVMSGTSMAAPQVTAAITYLLAYDPTLSSTQVKDALYAWSNADTTFGAAPRLDIFASVMSLAGAAKDLVDVNDRSVDGSQRARLDRTGPMDIPPLPIQPDSQIDMKDFRALRDAWLVSCLHAPAPDGACPASAEIAINGARTT